MFSFFKKKPTAPAVAVPGEAAPLATAPAEISEKGFAAAPAAAPALDSQPPSRSGWLNRLACRGGLDINPFRTSYPQALPKNVRTARQ